MIRTRLVFACLLFFVAISNAEDKKLANRIEQILARPELRHAIFGIKFYSLDRNETLYEHNEDKFFVPASTTKLITSGSALALFGPDYRFHTHVYRTAAVDADGILNGDLILVASGDPNLSARVATNGTLLFENEDHSYGGPDSHGIPGDPLFVIRQLASQVASRGIQRIGGRVLIDASLFPQGEKELGSGVVMSSIVVNDNVIDVLVSSGKKEGDPAVLKISPLTAYARFINQAVTGAPGSKSDLEWKSDIENGDGSRTVTITGNVPLGNYTEMFPYPVPDPARFAAIVFTEALREKGIVANPGLKEEHPDFKSLSTFYTSENTVAVHVSPPMTEEVKVILKVSQNLHASSMPYLFSAILARKDPPQAGFDLMHKYLSDAGLHLSGASQSDGAGGSAHFTPSFLVDYLKFISKQKYYDAFQRALPILGKDGTLHKIQTESPAAGNVFAKTGTWIEGDLLNQDIFVSSKALAGYITTKKGENLAFAVFLNNIRVATPDAVRDVAGQTVGEIAGVAYETR